MKDRKTLISIISLAITVAVLLGNLVWNASQQHTETIYIKESMRRIELEINAIGDMAMDFKQYTAVSEERFAEITADVEQTKSDVRELQRKVH